MKHAMTLTATLFALVISSHTASAQRSGGGGTIGCDPSAPTFTVAATQCRLFHKEVLYGPSANPYASAWEPAAPVAVRQKKIVKPKKASRTGKSSSSAGTGN